MIKGPILQENITIFNMCVSNNKVPNYMRQKRIEMQGEIDESTIIIRDFNTPVAEMDKSSRQKLRKDILYSTTPLIT